MMILIELILIIISLSMSYRLGYNHGREKTLLETDIDDYNKLKQ